MRYVDRFFVCQPLNRANWLSDPISFNLSCESEKKFFFSSQTSSNDLLIEWEQKKRSSAWSMFLRQASRKWKHLESDRILDWCQVQRKNRFVKRVLKKSNKYSKSTRKVCSPSPALASLNISTNCLLHLVVNRGFMFFIIIFPLAYVHFVAKLKLQNCVFNLEQRASERIKADSKNTNQYARYVAQVALYNCKTTRNHFFLKKSFAFIVLQFISVRVCFIGTFATTFRRESGESIDMHSSSSKRAQGG